MTIDGEDRVETQIPAVEAEAATPDTEVQTTDEPLDLGSALAALRATEPQVAAPAVPDTQGTGTEGSSATGEAGAIGELGAIPTGDDASTGGSAAGSEQIDYMASGRGLIQEINQQAAVAAQQRFREQGIKKLSVSDLYVRDERSGSVLFKNPENEGRPFATRMEAQQWCDSINRDIDEHFKQEAINTRNEYLEAAAPTLRLLAFAPKFDALDSRQQDVFDKLVAPYAITDEVGGTIGYSCDLDIALAQAQSIAAAFSTPAAAIAAANGAADSQPVAPAAPTGPALDMKTSGGAGTPAGEPKTLQEAFVQIRKGEKK